VSALPTFVQMRKRMGPSWLVRDGDGKLVGLSLDMFKDSLVELAREGLLARFPQNDPYGATAPEDALAALGRDRRIVRGISEPAVRYAARLLRWLDDWKTAGNPFALMQQLAGYTGPGPSFRTVDVRGNWYTRAVDGTLSAAINRANWDWDSDPYALTRWSRFWVIIYPNGLWSPEPTFGSGQVFGDPTLTIGTTATPEEVASVKAIVADWKPAGTRCVNIIIAFDSTSFDPTQPRDGTGLPDGTWGNWSKRVGQVRSASRLSTARYWDGV
jgi:hypothetical protein